MKLYIEVAIGGAGLSIVFGLFTAGHLGSGFFAVQLIVTLSALSLAPILKRFSAKVTPVLNYAFFSVLSLFVMPVFYALIMELFTGHQREGATPVDAILRIFAILVLWIGFAKLNEEFIKPALAKIPFFSKPRGNSLVAAREKAVKDKRTGALDAIKERMRPNVRRRKNAEKIIEDSEKELENARKQVEKTECLLKKKEKLISQADPDDLEDLKEEQSALQDMKSNSLKYLKTLEVQVKNAERDIKECNEASKRMEAEWNKVMEINSFTTFYR